MFEYLRRIWYSKDVRKKILFTLFALAIFRLAAHVSVPGVNVENMRRIFERNSALGAFAMLTGGRMENFSVILMGLSPYINASIIIQLLGVIIPKIEQLQKEGEEGHRKINQWTRYASVPLALLQSYGMITLLNRSAGNMPLIENISDPKVILPIMLTVVTGTVLLMWLGEIITEKGIANGISIIIFAGIVANIPAMIGQNVGIAYIGQDYFRLIPFAVMLIITFLLTVFVILTTEAQRNIPITYAGRRMVGGGEQSVIPIRMNQAGMIPIIFAVSIMLFPTVIAQFFQNARAEWLRNLAKSLINQVNHTSIWYIIIHFLLVFAFTYFYVSIVFNPTEVAENIQKRGGFIPGLRPGSQTADFLAKVSSRLTFFGGLCLAIVAVFPFILQGVFGSLNLPSISLLISGAGLIIVVGVVIEIINNVNAELVMHNYDELY